MLETETQPVQVRPAVDTDAESIVHAHFAAVHQTASDFYPREVLESWSRHADETRYQQIRQAIAKRNELFLVAEDVSGVVGFGSIVPALHELRAHTCTRGWPAEELEQTFSFISSDWPC